MLDDNVCIIQASFLLVFVILDSPCGGIGMAMPPSVKKLRKTQISPICFFNQTVLMERQKYKKKNNGLDFKSLPMAR